MIFCIFVAVLIAGLVMKLICIKSCRFCGGLYESMTNLFLFIGGLGVAASLIFMGIIHIAVNNQRKMIRIQYESLKYQVENKLYENDDYGKKKLIDQVTELNASIIYADNLKNDFWIGVYVTNPYSDLDPIEFK